MAADPSTMSISSIKEELRERGVTDLSGCIEKSDLITKLKEARAKPTPATNGKAAAPSPALFSLDLAKADVIGNTDKPKGIIVVSHGLGDTSAGWADVAEHIASQIKDALFVLPTAPHSPVTMNGGMRMPSWYDIRGLGPNAAEDGDGMRASAVALNALAQAACEKYKVSPENVIYMGFSQGAVISLWASIVSPAKVSGVVMLSGYLGARNDIAKLVQEPHKDVPILMCHGEQDPLISMQMSKMSHAAMVELLGLQQVTYKTYRGLQHSASPAEIADVTKWIAGLSLWK